MTDAQHITEKPPATIEPGAPATRTDTHLVPALIADLGEPASWRYVEFFTANIRNPNTRRENGEAVREIARSYNVHDSTISKLSAQEAFAWLSQTTNL